ncbi:MAG: fumarate hydratase [Nitrospinota bacterium]|nr:MAG: fumarate hydratase [Nitrospinota bacterium]
MVASSSDELGMREIRLQIPLQDADLQQLQLGDIVYLDGLIFTGRVGFYKRVLDEGQVPPIDIRNTCNVTFHCSPAVGEVAPGEYRISAVTATASFRFAKWIPQLLAQYGVKAVIGKGGMQEEIYQQAFRTHGAVYLTTVGYGLGAKYGRAIKRVVDVFWRQELGLAQAMWVLEVERLGPLLVECDTQGNSLQSLAQRELNIQFSSLYRRFPPPSLKRLGEIHSEEEEVL